MEVSYLPKSCYCGHNGKIAKGFSDGYEDQKEGEVYSQDACGKGQGIADYWQPGKEQAGSAKAFELAGCPGEFLFGDADDFFHGEFCAPQSHEIVHN